MGGEPLRRLIGEVRAQAALPVDAIATEPAAEEAVHGGCAARGPSAAGRADDYELLVEAIREGYLLHYRRGRVVVPDDPDLALLAGDQLYALGLALLAEVGDLDAVVELADVISLCAQAHAGGEPGLAAPIWAAGVRSVGWGPSTAHARAKRLARSGADGAAAALRSSVDGGDRAARSRRPLPS